jgi:hypothetical protein
VQRPIPAGRRAGRRSKRGRERSRRTCSQFCAPVPGRTVSKLRVAIPRKVAPATLRGQLGATWRRLFCGRGGTPASKVRDKPTERLIHAEAKAQTDDPAELCRKGNALAAYGIALRLVSCRVRRAQYAQGAWDCFVASRNVGCAVASEGGDV